jgi:hypothetical protein
MKFLGLSQSDSNQPCNLLTWNPTFPTIVFCYAHWLLRVLSLIAFVAKYLLELQNIQHTGSKLHQLFYVNNDFIVKCNYQFIAIIPLLSLTFLKMYYISGNPIIKSMSLLNYYSN